MLGAFPLLGFLVQGFRQSLHLLFHFRPRGLQLLGPRLKLLNAGAFFPQGSQLLLRFLQLMAQLRLHLLAFRQFCFQLAPPFCIVGRNHFPLQRHFRLLVLR